VPSGLRARVLTALLLAAAVVLILFWLPAGVAVLAVMVAVAAGAWEWAGLAGLPAPVARVGYTAAIGLATALAWGLTDTHEARIAFLWVAAAWWLVALAWLAAAPGRGGSRTAALAGFLVLVPAAVALGRLVTLEPNGQTLLLFLLVLIAAADVGAYFGGRRFGRRKLAPRVSPGKTVEGLAAGFAAAGLAAVAGANLLGFPVLPWLAVCLLVALVSVVGDLAESMFKRRAGLKDSGTLLPGHGGVLDRLDSLSAAGPVFLLGLYLLGVAG
jgi:phosphatidate cytidylyltransferase